MFYGFTFLLAWNVYIIYKKLSDCLETLIFASVMDTWFLLEQNIFLYTFKIRSVFERENDTQKTAERHNVKFRTDICDVKAMCQFWKFVSNT